MRKCSMLALVFVLTAVLLAGCWGQNNNNSETSEATIMPTVEMPTMTTTEETTEATSMPTEESTEASTETVGEDGVVGGETTESTENGAEGQGRTAGGNGEAAGGARSMPGVR